MSVRIVGQLRGELGSRSRIKDLGSGTMKQEWVSKT